jgi:hypothetical protein
MLFCYNVHDGSLLWQTQIDHTAVMDPELQKAARAERDFWEKTWLEYHAYCEKVEQMYNLATDAGLSPADMMKGGRLKALVDPTTVGEKGADLLKNPQIKALWTEVYATQQRLQMGINGDDGTKWLGDCELKSRAVVALKKYGLWFEFTWYGFHMGAFATPCTDGQRVYVPTINNAVAAVNLDGSIAWLVWDHMGDAKGERRLASSNFETRYHASPVLYGKYLIVSQDGHLRVYEKETGKKLWETLGRYDARREAFPFNKYPEMARSFDVMPPESAGMDWTAILKEYMRSGKARHDGRVKPEGTTPNVLEVPLPDGTIMPVLYEGACFMFRLEDGKVLDANIVYSDYSTQIAVGNLLIRAGATTTFLARLTAKDRDTLVYDYVYLKERFPEMRGKSYFPHWTATPDYTSIYFDGWWYPCFGDGGPRMSVTDGRSELGYPKGGGACSPILVGDRIYTFHQTRMYRDALAKVRTLTGPAPMHCQGIYQNAEKIMSEFAYMDETIKKDSSMTRRSKWASDAFYISMASPSAQANRMFFRTHGMLYCYGDPGEPFPKPKACPAEASAPAPSFEIEAAAIARESSVEKLATALSNAHARVRMEAAKRVSGFGVSDSAKAMSDKQVSGGTEVASGLTPETRHLQPLLEKLAKEDLSVAVRVEALKALGLGVDQPGGKALRELLAGATGSLGRGDVRVGELLRHLGAAAEPVAVSVMAGSNQKSKETLVMALMNRDMRQSDALRDALLAVTPYTLQSLEPLSQWPADPVVTTLFSKILADEKASQFHKHAVQYLLRALPEDQKNAMLAKAARAWGGQNNTAFLLERGAYDSIKSLVIETKARNQLGIIYNLCETAGKSHKPEQRKFAAEMVILALQDPPADPSALGGMVKAATFLGADAAPVLPTLKALKPAYMKDAANSETKAIAAIEAKVAAVEGKK